MLSCGEENGQARKDRGECCIIKEERVGASCYEGGGPGEEQVMKGIHCSSGPGGTCEHSQEVTSTQRKNLD